MSLDRSIRWRGLDPASIEHCHVISTERDTRIRGTIVTPDYGLFYRIKLDDSERVRTVRLERTDGAVLELFSDGAGNWSDDRAAPLDALRACMDIDIWPTPLTNSLPFWRCQWTIGEPQRFAMAWINADDMTVKRSEQIYTRLDNTRFRFQSADFEVELTVDADMLVVDYPGLFTLA
ncbi:MAG: putative glycolipid-binding domain-containing protein [Candidatus Devosia phytovorans]|uniref:Glycolipid-binding domain-containing protein n=1 Tax=Candidatus Devosia phytovorans TaxID=3121372 RepID=A0AAJ6B133_9HYPH|nr:putative glycolipid-binding domain-containing protein [Devosia sp.]WEK04884.1 MAG: putative glycolipid-binding domain-containing protein [Devosia sp.]